MQTTQMQHGLSMANMHPTLFPAVLLLQARLGRTGFWAPEIGGLWSHCGSPQPDMPLKAFRDTFEHKTGESTAQNRPLRMRKSMPVKMAQLAAEYFPTDSQDLLATWRPQKWMDGSFWSPLKKLLLFLFPR